MLDGPKLTRDQLEAVWREERPRLRRIQRDINKVLIPEEGYEEGNLEWLMADKARFKRYKGISGKHIKSATVLRDPDDKDGLSYLINALSLESATFMAIDFLLTGGLDYIRCKRKACGAFFWTTDPRTEHCCRECKEVRHREEPDPVTKERRRLKAIVDRRAKRWVETGNGIDPELAEVIHMKLLSARSIKQLAAEEKKYHLERERAGRKAKVDTE